MEGSIGCWVVVLQDRDKPISANIFYQPATEVEVDVKHVIFLSFWDFPKAQQISFLAQSSH